MSNSIKYPVALLRNTNKLVDVSAVASGQDCECYCYECEGDLIAINKKENKQVAHFRHKSGWDCNSNFETYLHWLAKELFKGYLTEIELPSIHLNTCDLISSEELNRKTTKIYNKHKVPAEFRHFWKEDYDLQSKIWLKIKECSTEESFETVEGQIQVDITLRQDNQPLFIEPFYTSPISHEKRIKLEHLGVSTLSINLRPFGPSKGFNFTIEELMSYLIDSKSKTWVFIREEKCIKLVENFLYQLEKGIMKNKTMFEDYRDIEKRLVEDESELEELLDLVSQKRKLMNSKKEKIKGFIHNFYKT